jgi:hypothetical protein
MSLDRWVWLSFVAEGPPRRFLGVALVRGLDVVDAVERAWALGINPGGEVLGQRVDPRGVPEPWRERLLSVEDLDRAEILRRAAPPGRPRRNAGPASRAPEVGA